MCYPIIENNIIRRSVMSYEFDAKKVTAELIEWVRNYFAETASPETKAVIGISGGKDSSIAAAVCTKALGKDRVIGVLMPQGEQSDISFSRLLVSTLGIQNYTINIGETVSTFFDEFKKHIEPNNQAVINTPARIRMTTLYAVAASCGGRVVNTCNLSEDWVGYSTKYGDAAGDFSPLSDLTVTEVLQVGDELGLPYEIVHKVPTDGLCGKTDEDNLGFTYAMLDRYIRGLDDLSDYPEIKAKIDHLHKANLHKLRLMPKYEQNK
jgi:NAD+ synthase